jgi:rod shape determining protein RodA
MALLGIIGLVIIKCFLIAYRAVDTLGQLIAGGVACLLLFQTFVNVGVATGLLPNTGMPFPFMSYGGTHMWTHMAAIGLVLNVGLTRAREDMQENGA